MKFTIKNLGIIREAEIELNGLTILTGLNDTGKSFLSKMIFGIIKTIKDAAQQYNSDKYELVSNLSNQILSSYRQYIPITPEKMQKFVNLNRVLESIISNPLLVNDSIPIIEFHKKEVIEDFNKLPPPTLKIVTDRNIITKIEDAYNSIVGLLNENIEEGIKFKNYFDKIVIQRLFQGQLNCLHSKDRPLEIIVSDGATQLLNIIVENNVTKLFNYSSIFLLKDATIIETPTIIQLERFIVNSLAFSPIRQTTVLPNHYYDLFEKIRSAPENTPTDYSEVFNGIKKIIGGQVTFSNEDAGIVFLKDNGAKIRSFNIASGIKSFGVLQMLLNSAAINKNCTLIVDEPEVHLHPEWENEYAKIIVKLTAEGIPIIISTHSYYFIRAIIKCAQQYNTVDITKFYFGEKEEKLSYFKDVSNDLDPVFTALAKPMQRFF